LASLSYSFKKGIVGSTKKHYFLSKYTSCNLNGLQSYFLSFLIPNFLFLEFIFFTKSVFLLRKETEKCLLLFDVFINKLCIFCEKSSQICLSDK